CGARHRQRGLGRVQPLLPVALVHLGQGRGLDRGVLLRALRQARRRSQLPRADHGLLQVRG
ncbi:hypothetical protein N0V85_010008, partial [Neurospora sp. IMI 360204]